MLLREKSQAIYAESCALIPGGVNSPVRAFPGLQMTPLIAASGKGGRVEDVDGHSYIDFCGSWGALILGHAHPAVVAKAMEQVQLGSSFGMATLYEKEIAAHILKHLSSIERIRFVSSGTEAVMSAIRLARGYTGKAGILKFDGNYHGHSDSLLIRAGSGVTALNPESSSLGVPPELVKHTFSLPYNDVETVRAFIASCDDLAAVLIEPIAGNMGVVPASLPFLKMLRAETEKKGIVLIFDEVISGFRVGLQGAQGLYQIDPDLTCLGKIIGGGFPAAAFGGKKKIMDMLAPLGQVYQAGTLSGNPVAMRAGLAALEEIEKEGFYEELERKTSLLLEGVETFIRANNLHACINRVQSMFTLFFGQKEVTTKCPLDEKQYNAFFKHLFEKGIYFPPCAYESAFVCSAHTDEDLIYTREVILDYLLSLLPHHRR